MSTPAPEPEEGPGAGLSRVRAEVAAETEGLVVTLVTDRGEADITVPPLSKWRSTARAALFSRGDDLSWALLTLSRDDAEAWTDLDPTMADVQDFMADWSRAGGEDVGGSRASRRSSARTRGR